MKAPKGTGSGYWMVLPAALAILAIVAYPLAFASYFSFRRILPGVPGEFIGLENYSRMLQDPDFAEALRTTVLFTVASGGLSFAVGLGLALLLSRPFAGREALAVVVATFGRLALFGGPVGQAAQVFGFGNGGLLLQENGVLLCVANGPVLADEYAGLLPLAGRGIYLQPFEMTQLQRDGRWDQRPLVASIERREFPAILIWKPSYASRVYREKRTPEMLETIDENYRPTHEYAGTLVYRLRPDNRRIGGASP